MSTDIKYVAKQILNLFDNNKIIAVSCATKIDLKTKNQNFESIVKAIKDAGVDFSVINYDSAYKGYYDVDATTIADEMSYNFDKVDYNREKVALVNINPILDKKEMLDLNGDLNKIVLSSTYGKTTFDSVEQLAEIVKDNGIEMLGFIANKR